MLISKLAICLAAVLWVIGMPTLAASAVFTAALAAALDYAALRAGNPAPQAGTATPGKAPSRQAVAAAVTSSLANDGAPTAESHLLRRLDADFGLSEVEAPFIENTPAAAPPVKEAAATLPVAAVMLAPGMLDTIAADTAPVTTAASSPSDLAPAAQPVLDPAPMYNEPAQAFDNLSGRNLSTLVADDGWSSEPPGGY